MSGTLFFNPIPAVLSRGVPSAGAKATFYISGTSTKATVYTSAAMSIAQSNPVVADGAGVLPTIYLDSTVVYRVVITDASGVLIPGCDIDPYTPGTIIGGSQGAAGVNGGTASNLTIGLFTGCAGQDLTSGGTKPAPDIVVTSGYRTVGKGGARYVKDAAVNSAFVTAHPNWSFRDSQGNGYRLAEEQKITFEMFGAYADGSTDDYPQWLTAKDFLQTYAVIRGNSYFKSVPPLYFNRASYRFSHYIDLTDGVYTLIGAGPSAVDRGGNTFFFPDPGVSGIVLQSWDTTGISGTTTNTPKGSAFSHIEDITVYGQGGTVGSANEIGILLKAPANLIRCNVHNMGGHGVFVAADVTHAGNANCGKMRDCVSSYNGLSGFRFEGGDSNAWELYGLNATNNITWGIHDLSFLGNHFFGYHTATNGVTTAGPSWAPGGARRTAQVYFSGHYYRVIPGQETWCSTNAPTGAATSNQGWLYVGDGSANAVYPAWANGTTYSQGGAFYVTGASTKTGVFGGYMESDQSPGYCDASRAVIVAGGFSGWHQPTGLGNVIGANDGRIVVPMLGTVGTNGNGIELLPDAIQIGPQCYFQRTSTEGFDLRGTLGSTLSMTRNIGAHQHSYSMSFPAGIILGADSGGYASVASAMPATGSYTQGAWIRNRTPAIAAGKVLLGWLRLTTGSAHVAGTDWTPVYGTTS